MKNLLRFLSRIFNTASAVVEKSSEGPIRSVSKSQDCTLIMTCREEDIAHLDGLSRYYETKYEGLLSRGIWLLTAVREAEIVQKRLAIIEIDENSGEVISVSPITVS